MNIRVGMGCWDPGMLTRGTFHLTKIPVHSSCTDPTHTPAHFVIVLVRRIQQSCPVDNNFVKWKVTFWSDQTRQPHWSKWTTFNAGPQYSGRTKLKWSVPTNRNFWNFGSNGKLFLPPASLAHKNPQRSKIIHGMRPVGCKDRYIDLNMCICRISHSCDFCGCYYGCRLTTHISFSLCCTLNTRTVFFFQYTVIQSLGICLQINCLVT